MTEKNGAAFPSPEDKSNHRHLERVVDELRSVLSDLGRPAAKKSDPAPVSPPEPEPKEEFLRPAAPSAFEAIKPDLSEPTPVSSDADFWNGNVLGWSDKDKKESLESFGQMDGSEALPDDPLSNLNLRELDGPLSESKANKILEDFETSETETNPTWGVEEPLMGTPELPQAPESPLQRFNVREEAQIPQPMRENPFSPTFSDFHEEQPILPPVEQPSPSPIPVPIPQTLERKPEPVKPPVNPNLNLEAPDLKPKGVVQIACIFPEGQEKLGQTFVSKLREVGEKSRKPVNIQAVFVHPWVSNKVDVAAWKKSAVLSGADTMFVLVSKNEASSLKTLSADPSSDIKCRIVYLEHIAMKTLYADILVDFQRGK